MLGVDADVEEEGEILDESTFSEVDPVLLDRGIAVRKGVRVVILS